MPKVTIIPGKKYGNLTVLSYSWPKPNKRTRGVRVKCSCGHEFECTINTLTHRNVPCCPGCQKKYKVGEQYGHIKILSYLNGVFKAKCKCGLIREVGYDAIVRGRFHTCKFSPKKPRKTLEKLEGRKYNRLKVINLHHRDKNGRRYWDCLCDCGSTAIVSTDKLKKGSTKSCGCYNKDRDSEPGEFGLRKIFRRTRDQALRRNITFQLSIEEFKEITKKNCFYCGVAPYMVSYKKQKERSQYIYMGIDRKDSSLSYTIDNCAPCCKICNWMKRTMSVNAFLTHIESIYRNILK